MTDISGPGWNLRIGNALERLPELEPDSIHTCVTSPPYWGLRDYGHPDQLGQEETPELYVEHLVEILEGVRRVLRQDGTLWLNLGDSYAGGGGYAPDAPSSRARARGEWTGALRPARKERHSARSKSAHARKVPEGLKPKDLIGLPWRVAFALQATGWWLRSDIVWSKPNPMPENVTDRPTKSHEYLFLLSKSARYFYDANAIAEAAIHAGRVLDYTGDQKANTADADLQRTRPRGRKITVGDTRNKRSVWTITAQPYPGAHFAVMPAALVEPCIKAGCPEGGIVLDPFAGTGTVGLVALRHGRHFEGIELSEEYAQLARDRMGSDAPLLDMLVQGI